MPNITQYQETQQVPAPQVRGGTVDPGAIGARGAGLGGGEELERGLSKLTTVMIQKEEEQARVWSSVALSKARLDWTQQFVDRQSDPEHVKDGAANFTPNLLKDFDDYAVKAIDAAPNAPSKRFMTERMEDLRADLGSKALVYEAKARIDWRKDQMVQAGNNVATLVAADPMQYHSALSEQLAIIDSSAMPQEQKSAVRQWMMDKVSQAAVWGQIQKSPNGFLQSVGFYGEAQPAGGAKTRRTSGDFKEATGNTAFDALPFDLRVKAFEQAVRSKAQIDADAERASKLQGDKAANDAMKDIWSAAYNPGGSKLTWDLIESKRPLLKENDYKAALQMLRTGPEQRTEPTTFAKLERLVYSRQYDEAEKFAYSAHRSGNLANDTLGSTLARIEQFRKEDGPKSPYERSRAFINRSLNPGEINYDPVRNQRLADALREYDNWSLSNPKAGEKDHQERSAEIVKAHQLLNFRESVLTLPMPLGTTIRRTNDPAVLEADIAKAKMKLDDLLANGKINKTEHTARTGTLKKWIDTANEIKGNK